MKFVSLYIENFRSIKRVDIAEIDDACILVGKNNTGKSSVLDALLAVCGKFKVLTSHFEDPLKPIKIGVVLEIDETEDLWQLHRSKKVSNARKFDKWFEEFEERLPSYRNGKLSFEYRVMPGEKAVYDDGVNIDNRYIRQVLPEIYYIDHERDITQLERALLNIHDMPSFDVKPENVSGDFIEKIDYKKPSQLTNSELVQLIQRNLYKEELDLFAEKVNGYLHDNGELAQTVSYNVEINYENLFHIETVLHNNERGTTGTTANMSGGTRSIYLLSLLQAYVFEEEKVPSIIMIEDPEIYLHPQLQKTAAEILYKLSKQNQVFFTTYSPNMIFNFSSKQIKQTVLDKNYYTEVLENADVDDVLNDLGYSAGDFMNVSFVFIVEGKQDQNRLPMLLEKYYSELRDENGNLQRISIIPTNSCTNIKTYANLKYINSLYLKDQFLIIRDSDGKNPRYLVKQLCNYYEQRSREDDGHIPKINPKNVLVLKYYSFENYFLDPATMVKIGVIRSEEEFYEIFLRKYNEYLRKIPSMKRVVRTMNVRIHTTDDVKRHLETIKTYVRGHNLYDIYYGRYKHENEDEILRKYIEVAPREVFRDILDAIDRFVYFDNRKTESSDGSGVVYTVDSSALTNEFIDGEVKGNE